MKDKQISALTKYACPACGNVNEDATAIVIGKRLQDMSELHNQVLGFSDDFCKSCQELAKKGIILVLVDGSKTTDKGNPYRTGQIAVVTEDFIKRVFKEPEVTLNKRLAFVDLEAAKAIGLLDKLDQLDKSSES